LELGLKGMIGKGYRSEYVVQSIKKNKAVYFIAIGGAGAIASKSIRKAEVIAYPDLGPEAMFLLEVQDFPVIVANDVNGNDIFKEGVKKYIRY
ncbi:MAG: fumarate hydratase C-terminal domain-containing protein, partial [Methanosarcinales archaeon]